MGLEPATSGVTGRARAVTIPLKWRGGRCERPPPCARTYARGDNPRGVSDHSPMPRYRLRSRYGIDADAIVVGFIESFGRWHGAEVAAHAIVHMDSEDIRFLEDPEGAVPVRRRRSPPAGGRGDRQQLAGAALR